MRLGSRRVLPSGGRSMFGVSSVRPMPHLVENEIADPLAAIAQEAQRAGVDEIGEQNAVPRLYFRPHWIGRVPGIVADRKRVAAVGGEPDLGRAPQASVTQALVKDRADVRI